MQGLYSSPRLAVKGSARSRTQCYIPPTTLGGERFLNLDNFLGIVRSAGRPGDPTAVGYGGAPGSLRSEETPIPYTPGTVGVALAGRDTGGSQFFVVHSPQPHLTGVYSVIGRVVEGRRFVDRIQPGDALRIRLAGSGD